MVRKMLLVVTVFVLVLLGASGAVAQEPALQPPGPGGEAQEANSLETVLGTGFSYQGRLTNGGAPVNGTCDMRFGLWNALSGGAQLGSLQTVSPVPVSNGLFTIVLNAGGEFGPSAFNGEARYLAIEVRCPVGVGSFVALLPRQMLAAAPYAIHAQHAASLYAPDGSPQNAVYVDNDGKVGIGTTGPVAYLQVVGSAQDANGGALVLGQTNASNLRLGYHSDYSWIQSHMSKPLAINPLGNSVGIGTTTPTGILEIKTGSNLPGLKLTSTGPGWGSGILFNNMATGGKAYGAYSASDGKWHFSDENNRVDRLVIDSSGRVGVGTPNPGRLLEVGNTNAPSDGVIRYSHRDNSDPTNPDWRSWDVGTGEPAFGDNDFFGIRDATVNATRLTITTAGNVGIGTTSPQEKLDVAGAVRIQGGVDLAERFEISEGSAEPGTLMAIDDEHPGLLRASNQAYDTRVAGVVSGAGGIRPGLILYQPGMAEGDTAVAMVGRVYVKAEAMSAPIRPGDLLTSSDIAGHAMKAADRARAQGAIIGKAMSGLETGQGLVLVLVNLQ